MKVFRMYRPPFGTEGGLTMPTSTKIQSLPAFPLDKRERNMMARMVRMVYAMKMG